MTPAERASAYVAKMDAAIAGQGGSQAASLVACKIVEFGLDSASAMDVFAEYNRRCRPPWSERDLARKLAWAAQRTRPKAEFTNDLSPNTYEPPVAATRAWPLLNTPMRDKVIAQGFGVADLMEDSADFPTSAMDALRVLFPGNPLICCGMDSYKFETRPLAQWSLEAHEQQLIAPSPMTSETGKTLEGKISAHALENTGPRRYAVIEFDTGTTDEQAGLIIHLAGYAPLVMAVHSAGKSIHAWFYVSGQDESRILKFYRYAVTLGADHHTHLRSQFVRMPEGTRPKGGLKLRQPVYFWRPERIK